MADVNSWIDVYCFPASNTPQLFSESEASLTQETEDNQANNKQNTDLKQPVACLTMTELSMS